MGVFIPDDPMTDGVEGGMLIRSLLQHIIRCIFKHGGGVWPDLIGMSSFGSGSR